MSLYITYTIWMAKLAWLFVNSLVPYFRIKQLFKRLRLCVSVSVSLEFVCVF